VFVALPVDAQGDHDGVARHLNTIQHQHTQLQLGQVFGRQLAQSALGPSDELPRHGRWGGPAAVQLTDRFQADRVLPRRDPGQHAFRTIVPAISCSLNAFQSGRTTSSPWQERTRGLSTTTLRPPKVRLDGSCPWR